MNIDNNIIGALAIGSILHGRNYDYQIVKVLGQGTFGITYLASFIIRGELGVIETGAKCAIKEFFMKDFNGRIESTVTCSNQNGSFGYYKEKFIKEAIKLGKLKHSNIIQVMELFEENSTAYYVMEYIDGGTLDDQIFNGLSEIQAIKYTKQIGGALEYMHSQNMLHLDLKPNNIMIRNNGEAILIDFGLSKQFDANGKPETDTKVGYGTPGYSPLEQARFDKNDYTVLPATMDIYALGATLFKMITGSRPPEASMILNDGFPADELDRKNCSSELKRVIEKSMAPKTIDRYKTMSEFLKSLPKEAYASGKNGYYKKKIGDREYGTFEIQKIPVTDSLGFNAISLLVIRVTPNDKRGLGYEFRLEDSCGAPCNKVKVWYDKKLIYEKKFPLGIPEDVKKFLIEHGFLSTTHWELENVTSPIEENFGYDVSVFIRDSKSFERRVQHAHPQYHDLLLSEVKELVQTTSLNKYIEEAKRELNSTKVSIFKELRVPDEITAIFASFSPSQITGRTLPEKGYMYGVFTNSSYFPSVISRSFPDVVREKLSRAIPIENFNCIRDAINDLKLKIGPIKEYKDNDFSEVSGRLILSFWSKDQGLTELSLTAFNTDMSGGNIYGVNINELAGMIDKIFQQNLSRINNSIPTKELVHSIPEYTTKIMLEYMKGGVVGLSPIKVRIDQSNPEFSKLKDGLKSMKLRSQEIIERDPPAGVINPCLEIGFYNDLGKEIKFIYAEDAGDLRIGNINMTVEELRERISAISPFYSNIFDSHNNKKQSIEKANNVKGNKRNSPFNIFLSFNAITVLIVLAAIPLFYFEDSFTMITDWMWILLAISELTLAVLFNIGWHLNKSKGFSTFERVTLVVGILALLAYLILWIILLCKWYA